MVEKLTAIQDKYPEDVRRADSHVPAVQDRMLQILLQKLKVVPEMLEKLTAMQDKYSRDA